MGALILSMLAVPMRAPSSASLARGVRASRPNILLLVADDQTWSTFDRTYMPHVFSELVDHGMEFTRGYIDDPLCCPARAGILTGLGSYHSGVDLIPVALNRPTIVQALHDSGYRTVLAGKYLNSYPCHPALPEFDDWMCEGVGANSYTMMDPTLNVNGTNVDFSGYTTDILANEVSTFIAETPPDQPFFAMYTPASPHLPANDDRCQSIGVDPYRPPSYDEDTLTDGKPDYVSRRPLTTSRADGIDSDHARMFRETTCLDMSIETILQSLGDRAQNTVVIYLSDNGYLYGEHRLDAKMVPYEESVRVPVVVRAPMLHPTSDPATSDALIESLDIAPTVGELAGVPWSADGHSIVPLLDGSASSVRDAVLVEHCEGLTFPCWGDRFSGDDGTGRVIPPSYFGIVTESEKLVQYVTGEEELYDLGPDPFELTNQVADQGHGAVLTALRADLAALVAGPPVDTTIVTGPSGAITSRTAAFTYFSQSLVARFQCRLSVAGVRGTWSACDGGSFRVGGLADGDYTFEVKATDEHGQTDPTPATRGFSITTTGPAVTFSETPPAHTRSSMLTFKASGSVPGLTYECSLATLGVPEDWSACDPTVPITYGPVADALWSFEVRATDASQETTDPPSEWLVDVDNEPPTTDFVLAPHAVTDATSAHFVFWQNEPVQSNSLTCSLDGQPIDCSRETLDLSGLIGGRHTLAVTATDEVGNSGTSSYAWTVDLTRPTGTILSGPPRNWNSSIATFELSSSEPDGETFRCSLDGDPLIACGSKVVFEAVEEGPHSFTMEAIDAAENASDPVTLAWTQDTIAPTLAIVSGPPSSTRSTTAKFQLSSSEPSVFLCSLDGAAFVRCSAKQRYSGLAVGAHIFTAEAKDRAGNVSADLAWSWTITP